MTDHIYSGGAAMQYAGIGAQITPDDVLDVMEGLGQRLEERGYFLRSGGAAGADTAFARSVAGDNKDLILPSESTWFPHWAEHAKQFHPNWKRCGRFARMAHARNSAIILGRDLKSPVDFVVCWTPDAAVVGGTGQALRVAAASGILVFNLARAGTLEALEDYAELD